MAQLSQEILQAITTAKEDKVRALQLGYETKRARLVLTTSVPGTGSFAADVGGMDFGKLLQDGAPCAMIFSLIDTEGTIKGAGADDFVFLGWTPPDTSATDQKIWSQVLGGLRQNLKGLVFKELMINQRDQATVAALVEAASAATAKRASQRGVVSKCPFASMVAKTTAQPQKLNLKVLAQPTYQHLNGDYASHFKKLDLAAVKKDLVALCKTSQDWWPADYGHYGPFFVRLAWHSSGTYRVFDGRGGANAGNMRFDPHGSWPDNGNLDKARRLLWPIKKKYGKALSWGDLMILVGNAAMEDMGFKTLGFGGGRVDCWATEEDAYWGTGESYAGLMKSTGGLERPLGNIQMELIYVNPEGPYGNPDPLLAAAHIRETFTRMGVNDEETVALIAGGHTFGKAHGAGPADGVGPPPKDAPIESQGFGWKSSHGTGKGKDAVTSGLEGAWTAKPTQWDHGYFENLFAFEYELTTSPAGAKQWRPVKNGGADMIPDAFDSAKKHPPMMFTTDLAIIKDPAYLEISQKFHADPKYFAEAFAKAWYKLTHRDMGNVRRLLGSEIAGEQSWQDPVAPGPALSDEQATALKEELKKCGLTPKQMVTTAWASACTFRHTDFRGGTNGGRLFLAPQKDWEINDPAGLAIVKDKYAEIQAKQGGKVSIADLIVLGGCAGVEEAAKMAGVEVKVPFTGGRGDATQEQTDVQSFGYLEPVGDGFRNHNCTPYLLVDRAHLLSLTVPEMTCLLGGMRSMGVNSAKAGNLGVFSDKCKLDNTWFDTLLDMAIEWKPNEDGTFKGLERGSTTEKFTATAVDLAFGSNPELRAVSEFYAMDDSGAKFVEDFVKVWAKVMDLDRSL